MSNWSEEEKKVKSYTYKRFMRDGSVEERTAVIRSRSANKKKAKENKSVQDN